MRAVIESLTAEAARAATRDLDMLLEDAVDSGASIGFLPPLGPTEAADYWAEVAAAVAGGSRVLLVARDADGALVGSAQLGLETRPNGRHRAEVMKVMVHRKARRRGLGRDLMLAAEAEARSAGGALDANAIYYKLLTP
jgi:acetyltransferase